MLTSSTNDLANDDLRQLVEQLIGEVGRLRERVRDLEEENAALKDEVARLKGLKGRLTLKPSGMEKGTARPKGLRGKNVWIGCGPQVRMRWIAEVADMYEAYSIGSRAVAVMGHTHAPWSH